MHPYWESDKIVGEVYKVQKKEQNYKINEYAADVRNTHWSLHAFGREAGASRRDGLRTHFPVNCCI